MALDPKYSVRNVDHAVERDLFTNFSMSAPVLVQSATTDLIRVTNATTYSIAGETKILAATAAVPWTAGQTYVVQAADTVRFYTISVDAAGTIHIVQGDAGTTAALPRIPAQVDNTAMLGVMKVVTVGVTFTPDTTALNAAGVTTTFRDYNRMPTILNW